MLTVVVIGGYQCSTDFSGKVDGSLWQTFSVWKCENERLRRLIYIGDTRKTKRRFDPIQRPVRDWHVAC